MARRRRETEWNASANPDVLLNEAQPPPYLGDKPNPAYRSQREVYDRRLRLFGCACARMVWDMLPTDARSAVAISERFADSRATRADLNAAAVRITPAPVTCQQHALCAAGFASLAAVYLDAYQMNDFSWNPADAARSAAKALATRTAGQAPPRGTPQAVEWELVWCNAYNAARAHQAELVRDIFPPPGVAEALRCEAAWLTSTVLALARQAGESGEYGVLPILADALQDAGCDNEFMLARCRAEAGIHARGNWVVDLLLGRE